MNEKYNFLYDAKLGCNFMQSLSDPTKKKYQIWDPSTGAVSWSDTPPTVTATKARKTTKK